jgi:hypothetical protein
LLHNVTFDDPRRDPVSRAWASSLIDSEHSLEGFAEIVRAAGSPRRIGRQPGAAQGAVERGVVELAPCWIADGSNAETEFEAPAENAPRVAGADRLLEAPAPPRLVEGAAVVSRGSNQALAHEFLKFLAETRAAGPDPDGRTASRGLTDPALEDLVAELVGATLVDPQDELWAAWSALNRSGAGAPDQALKWMTEPPPWPPASIARLLARGDSDALSSVDALAQEIAPEAPVRVELMRSWLAAGRALDRDALSALAHLADGRLIAEPRFRAWLRAEWTVWARQRFRRVERIALARRPSSLIPQPSSTNP